MPIQAITIKDQRKITKNFFNIFPPMMLNKYIIRFAFTRNSLRAIIYIDTVLILAIELEMQDNV